MRRSGSLAAMLALLAIAVLIARPVALDALDAPFGSHNSPEVRFASAEGSPHCALLADCETVSISNVGLDFGQAAIVLVLTGLVLAVATPVRRKLSSWPALVPTPPPLSSLG